MDGASYRHFIGSSESWITLRTDTQAGTCSREDGSLENYLRCRVIMAFVLVIIVEGSELESPQPFLFRDINRCRYFEQKIEHRQKGITSYCVPRWVSANSVFND